MSRSTEPVKIGFLDAIAIAWKIFKICRHENAANGVWYCHREKLQVPDTAILVAVGRQAWRISQLAIEAFEFHSND